MSKALLRLLKKIIEGSISSILSLIIYLSKDNKCLYEISKKLLSKYIIGLFILVLDGLLIIMKIIYIEDYYPKLDGYNTSRMFLGLVIILYIVQVSYISKNIYRISQVKREDKSENVLNDLKDYVKSNDRMIILINIFIIIFKAIPDILMFFYEKRGKVFNMLSNKFNNVFNSKEIQPLPLSAQNPDAYNQTTSDQSQQNTPNISQYNTQQPYQQPYQQQYQQQYQQYYQPQQQYQQPYQQYYQQPYQ